MGVVYRALDPSLNRHVAIKVMSQGIATDQELRDRFLREARAAGSLQHPNIITIYDFGDAGGSLYIAMEYVEGSDLSVMMERQDPLPLTAKIDIVVDVLHALDYAHHRGVVHRDVKPGNIRVAVDGRAKLMDFGIARLEKSDLTKSGMMIGTPDYMAPEQITGEPVTAATDVFAVGAVLYEFLTLKQIWGGESLHRVLYMVVHDQPPPLREANPAVPQALQPVVDKALAKDPAQRYASAGAMAEALLEVRAVLSQGSAVTIRARRTPLTTERAKEPWDASEPPPLPPLKTAVAAKVATAVTGFSHRRPRLLGGIVGALAMAAVALLLIVPRIAQRPAAPANPAAAAPDTLAKAPQSGSVAARPAAPESGTATTQVVPAPSGAGDAARRAGPAGRRPSAPSPASDASQASAPPPTLPTSPPSGAVPGTTAVAVRPFPKPFPSNFPTASDTAAAPQAQAAPPVATPVQPPAPASPAVASAPPDPGPALEELVAAYARAISARSIADIRRVYPALSAEQQRDWEQFFRSVSAIRAQLAIVRQDVSGGGATLGVSGTYDYEAGGRQQHQDVSFRATAALDAGAWKLTSVR